LTEQHGDLDELRRSGMQSGCCRGPDPAPYEAQSAGQGKKREFSSTSASISSNPSGKFTRPRRIARTWTRLCPPARTLPSPPADSRVLTASAMLEGRL
jgi:hypothetical protein